jgi:hypothetical protein
MGGLPGRRPKRYSRSATRTTGAKASPSTWARHLSCHRIRRVNFRQAAPGSRTELRLQWHWPRDTNTPLRWGRWKFLLLKLCRLTSFRVRVLGQLLVLKVSRDRIPALVSSTFLSRPLRSPLRTRLRRNAKWLLSAGLNKKLLIKPRLHHERQCLGVLAKSLRRWCHW